LPSILRHKCKPSHSDAIGLRVFSPLPLRLRRLPPPSALLYVACQCMQGFLGSVQSRARFTSRRRPTVTTGGRPKRSVHILCIGDRGNMEGSWAGGSAALCAQSGSNGVSRESKRMRFLVISPLMCPALPTAACSSGNCAYTYQRIYMFGCVCTDLLATNTAQISCAKCPQQRALSMQLSLHMDVGGMKLSMRRFQN
jgi:hypothetical protein